MIAFPNVRIDWPEYYRNHADRRNLLIHLFAVPLFVGATLSLLFALPIGDLRLTLTALLIVALSLVFQGRGHALERSAPRPFSSPANFLRRWFTEQFITFPLFLVSGRWWKMFRQASKLRKHVS